jgi:predicted kinase
MTLVRWIQEKHKELVVLMMKCSHHTTDLSSLNPYHLEGDVWSHTLLVLEKAKNLPKIIQFALLCHDIGKIYCRRENEGRVSFKGHEVYSAYISLELSKDYGFSKEEQLYIFKLISYHTSILKKLEQDESQSIVLRQQHGHPELFIDLLDMTYADGLGRVMEKLSPRLDFIDDYYSGILDTMLNNPKDKEDNQKTVTCLIGLPASGKTSWIKNNKISNELIISRDDIAINKNISLNKKLSKKDKDTLLKEVNLIKESLVSKNKNIYIDMVNIVDRDRYASVKHIPLNYWFKAVIIITPLNILKTRSTNRDKKISWDYYEYLLKNSSMPLYDEFDEIEWIIQE